MTTLAISSPPLRRLFSLLDFAPQPKSEDLARPLEYWREKRGQQVLPRREEFDEAETGVAPRMFLSERCDLPGDYRLVAGAEVASSLLSGLKTGDDLRQAKNRRVAVRLRRLFDCVREAGEPVLAEFIAREDRRLCLAEILAAPVAESKGGRAAILAAQPSVRWTDRRMTCCIAGKPRI